MPGNVTQSNGAAERPPARAPRRALVVLALAAMAAPAAAQLPATRIVGSAISSTGEWVVGAQVRVIGSANAPAVTNDTGKFDLHVLGDTVPRLVIRRIGFRPETVTVRLPQAATSALVVRMTRTIQLVRPVVVLATRDGSNTVIAAMRERERTGGNGYFTYRTDFMKYNPAAFSDVLRRIPGVQIARTQRNFTEVRLRGNHCAPLYWIDNQPLLGIPFDPDVLPPQTVEAIEVYSSASLVPPQFQGPPYAQGCGAIVIWTRQGERPVRAPKIDSDSIIRLLDAHRVFVASEVDQPARVVSMQEPEYPDSLRGAGVSGSAVVEFIIESDGHLNRESIGVVSATHIRFADAVRLAVLEATFQPAMKAERPVAQVYQLPVTFTAPRP
jgi:TonB family protein